MKKITLLLVVAFTSCGISYDGEERLILQTNVVDRYGNPLKDIETLVQINDGNIDESISNGLSDVNGNKLLIFPAPKSATMSVYFTDLENEYERKRIYQIELTDFVNYKLNLENVVLYKSEDITQFEVNLQASGENTSLRNLSIDGQIPTINESFHPQNSQDDGYFQTYFSVLKNQQLMLNYTIRNNETGNLNTYSIPIDIGNEAVEYTLIY
jgi:hypothetical protein